MPFARANETFKAGYARRLEFALAASLATHLVVILVYPPHERRFEPFRIPEPMQVLPYEPPPAIVIVDPEPDALPSVAAARAIGPMPIDIVSAPVPEVAVPEFAESWEPKVPGGAGDPQPWDSAPSALTRIEPVYPSIAREAQAEGTVWVEIRIEADGSVSFARVVQSDTVAALEAAAVAAARGWLFDPARRRGEAVACLVRIPFRFSLD